VRYTVSSRGRPIGVTDLGFVRIGGPIRAGWFHPSADGERLIEQSPGTQPFPNSWAELPDLTLHHEDGSLVPTTSIGIQDTERLLALAEAEEARRDLAGWDPDDDAMDAEVEAMLAADGLDDACLDGEVLDAMRAGEAPPPAWAPDEEPAAWPRYQIHLVLVEADAIP
jgi:hypothetical protein